MQGKVLEYERKIPEIGSGFLPPLVQGQKTAVEEKPIIGYRLVH